MKRAVCFLRPEHIEMFSEGLKKLGYKISNKDDPTPDLAISWNRYGDIDKYLEVLEARGTPVLIAEHGWIGKDDNGFSLFALCRSQHNGAGTWNVGDEDRWSRLQIELKPWREKGEKILVLPQRGIGPPGVAMPRKWGEDVKLRLEQKTARTVRVRKHPGKNPKPLWPEFVDCHAAVIWASGAGIKAIVEGIPVFYEMPSWLGGLAATFGIDDLETPWLGDRLPMLQRLAWAQWTKEEIKSGEAIACTLQ